MKLGTSGWRRFHDYITVKETLDRYDITSLVVGDATGADSLVRRYCREVLGIEPIVKYADWKRYGNQAGPIRNREIIYEGIERLVAFLSRYSRGTRNMIEQCEWNNVPVDIVHI